MNFHHNESSLLGYLVFTEPIFIFTYTKIIAELMEDEFEIILPSQKLLNVEQTLRYISLGLKVFYD